MAKSTLTIFGATGNQGNSTADFVLSDPELSQRYNVRAVSRDITNPKMLDLEARGAELAQGDLDDIASLPSTVRGADYLFFMTSTQYQGDTREVETRQARNLCEVAIKEGVQYVIFSSMSHPYKISEGKIKNVEHFDCKAEIEEYIRGLPVKSAFFAPGTFMQNFLTQFRPRPSPTPDQTFILGNIANPDTELPFIDITDTGKWVGAILGDPQKYEGRRLAAAENFYTFPQACEIVSKVTGKNVTFRQLPDEVFKSLLPEGLREALYDMWVHIRDYGYYGSEQEALVGWTKQQAKGNLTTLEDWLRKEKYSLE